MKKLIVFALSLIMIISCGILTSAETVPTITVSNPTALVGEEVTVDVSISNNPGIMAMSFCIMYDNSVFEYVEYEKGYLSSCKLKDHTEKGKIAFVNDEKSDKTNNGVMMSLKFKIKDNAAVGKYTISIANQNNEKYGNRLHNSFCNSNMVYIVPNVVAGSITVDGKCEDVGHRFGSWTVTTPASCNVIGEKERICEKCGHPERDDIPFTHDFEEEWTVDKAATPTEQGVMSRHCKKCEAVTDELKFDYEDTIPEDTSSNQSGTSSNQSGTSSNQSSASSSQSNTSSNQSNTSSNQSSTSSNQNSSSGNQSASASTNTTTSNEGSTADGSSSSESEKTPINNTVGSKNPLSSVENLKDYQENVKPNTDSSKHETANTSSVVSKDESQVSSEPSSSLNSSDDTNSKVTNVTEEEKEPLSSAQITALIIGAALSLLIIAGAILLILKRNKKQ